VVSSLFLYPAVTSFNLYADWNFHWCCSVSTAEFWDRT